MSATEGIPTTTSESGPEGELQKLRTIVPQSIQKCMERDGYDLTNWMDANHPLKNIQERIRRWPVQDGAVVAKSPSGLEMEDPRDRSLEQDDFTGVPCVEDAVYVVLAHAEQRLPIADPNALLLSAIRETSVMGLTAQGKILLRAMEELRGIGVHNEIFVSCIEKILGGIEANPDAGGARELNSYLRDILADYIDSIVYILKDEQLTARVFDELLRYGGSVSAILARVPLSRIPAEHRKRLQPLTEVGDHAPQIHLPNLRVVRHSEYGSGAGTCDRMTYQHRAALGLGSQDDIQSELGRAERGRTTFIEMDGAIVGSLKHNDHHSMLGVRIVSATNRYGEIIFPIVPGGVYAVPRTVQDAARDTDLPELFPHLKISDDTRINPIGVLGYAKGDEQPFVIESLMSEITEIQAAVEGSTQRSKTS